MRIVLILVNLLLAVWLLAVVAGRFTGGKAEAVSYTHLTLPTILLV